MDLKGTFLDQMLAYFVFFAFIGLIALIVRIFRKKP